MTSEWYEDGGNSSRLHTPLSTNCPVVLAAPAPFGARPRFEWSKRRVSSSTPLLA